MITIEIAEVLEEWFSERRIPKSCERPPIESLLPVNEAYGSDATCVTPKGIPLFPRKRSMK